MLDDQVDPGKWYKRDIFWVFHFPITCIYLFFLHKLTFSSIGSNTTFEKIVEFTQIYAIYILCTYILFALIIAFLNQNWMEIKLKYLKKRELSYRSEGHYAESPYSEKISQLEKYFRIENNPEYIMVKRSRKRRSIVPHHQSRYYRKKIDKTNPFLDKKRDAQSSMIVSLVVGSLVYIFVITPHINNQIDWLEMFWINPLYLIFFMLTVVTTIQCFFSYPIYKQQYYISWNKQITTKSYIPYKILENDRLHSHNEEMNNTPTLDQSFKKETLADQKENLQKFWFNKLEDFLGWFYIALIIFFIITLVLIPLNSKYGDYQEIMNYGGKHIFIGCLLGITPFIAAYEKLTENFQKQNQGSKEIKRETFQKKK